MPGVSSPYFNKIKRTYHLGKWHALSLEILWLVSWVRCGTWLYRFLIFAPLLTSIIPVVSVKKMFRYACGSQKWATFDKSCLIDLILDVLVNNFSVMSGWVFLGTCRARPKQGLMCLVKGHNVVMLLRLKFAALQPRIKRSTTEPLRSPLPNIIKISPRVLKLLSPQAFLERQTDRHQAAAHPFCKPSMDRGPHV